VPIAGVGLLTTHSAIAAAEMDGMISVIRPALANGHSVDAVLRVDQLHSPGHHFAVPRIELDGVSFEDLALAATQPPAIGPAPAEPLALAGGE
jgi:hypothetical protein